MNVKNPLHGSLLKRRLLRANYCITHKATSGIIKMFKAECGDKPDVFLAKNKDAWLKLKDKITGGNNK